MMKCLSVLSLLSLLLFSACDERKIEYDLIFLHDYAARFQLSGGEHHARYKELTEAHLALIETLEFVRKMVDQKPEVLAGDFEGNFLKGEKIIEGIDVRVVYRLLEAEMLPEDKTFQMKVKMEILLARAFQSYFSLLLRDLARWYPSQLSHSQSVNINLQKAEGRIRIYGSQFRAEYEDLDRTNLSYWDRKRIQELKDDLNTRMLASRFWPTRVSKPFSFYSEINQKMFDEWDDYFQSYHYRVVEIESEAISNIFSYFSEDAKRSSHGLYPSWDQIIGRMIHFMALRNEWYAVYFHLKNDIPFDAGEEGEKAFLIVFKAELLAEKYTEEIFRKYLDFIQAEIKRVNHGDLEIENLLELRGEKRGMRVLKLFQRAITEDRKRVDYLKDRWYASLKIQPSGSHLVQMLFQDIEFLLKRRPDDHLDK